VAMCFKTMEPPASQLCGCPDVTPGQLGLSAQLEKAERQMFCLRLVHGSLSGRSPQAAPAGSYLALEPLSDV